MTPRVSVVIPTVGRPSVQSAVASVRQQVDADGEPIEAQILVVFDGTGEPPAFDDDAVEVLRTGGGKGASAARNVGFAAAQGEFVALLDDDDLWLPDHLATGLAYLDAHPDAGIHASRALVLRGDRTRIEPVEAMGDRMLVDHLFGADLWRARNRRVLTPTLIVRRAVTERSMDESLTSWEDIWWLLEAEHAGARIHQSTAVTVVVRGSDARAQARDGGRNEAEWAARLASIEPAAGGHYLVGMLGRAAARAGRPDEAWALAAEARRLGHPVAWPVVALEVAGGAAARGVGAARRIVRRVRA